jgi:hypothetical protein
MELYHYFGDDLVLTPNGQLRMIDGELQTIQRLYRRLLTNQKGYLWHTSYGAGLPQYIGRTLTPALIKEIKGVIIRNMYQESTVAQSPPPEISLNQSGNILFCTINYTSKTTGLIYTLSFNVTE